MDAALLRSVEFNKSRELGDVSLLTHRDARTKDDTKLWHDIKILFVAFAAAKV